MLRGIGWVDAASFPDQSYRVEDKKKNQHYFALLWILIENCSASAAQGISFTTSKTTEKNF